MMNKNEFLNQFSQLNTHIESALASQDFERAMQIDMARRQMIHEFAASTMPDGDKAFFETLERCAADNARAITQMTAEMDSFQRSAKKTIRGLNGYRS